MPDVAEGTLHKVSRLRRFKLDQGKIWQECSSGSLQSLRIDCRSQIFDFMSHFQEMAVMMSVHAEKCCHLVTDEHRVILAGPV